MTTLESVAYGIEEEALSHTGAAARRLMDAAKQIRELASQPVAQGEAVAKKLREILTVGGYRTDGDLATLIERVHFMALSNRDLALMQETLIKRHEESRATPTIPTGHRVVPVEPTESAIDAVCATYGLGSRQAEAVYKTFVHEMGKGNA